MVTTSNIGSSDSTMSGSSSQDMVNRVVQGAHQAVDRLADKAAPAVERLRNGMQGATQALHTGAEDMSEMQRQWMENARGCVREHPILSVAVAVGAGMLLSKMMAR